MNIVDIIIIVILLLHSLKGFKNGLLPTLVNFVGMFLVFIMAFYIKQPLSILLYENLPFLSFAGIFKGIIAINILLYEAIAYGISILVLGIIFKIIKRLSKIIEKIVRMTILLSLPSKILGAVIGAFEGLLFCFILIIICSVINNISPYIKESKYSSIILTKTPIINNITGNFNKSIDEVYDVIMKNKNNNTQANLESIDILMKYEILSYDSAIKLLNDGKLKVNGIENVIEKYKEIEHD